MFPVPAVWAFPLAANKQMAMKIKEITKPLNFAGGLNRLSRIEASSWHLIMYAHKFLLVFASLDILQTLHKRAWIFAHRKYLSDFSVQTYTVVRPLMSRYFLRKRVMFMKTCLMRIFQALETST
jgi:hypothetical protein